VTINACANASKTIKLLLLLIGKSKNPRCFKHINGDNLPVIYCNQSNAVIFTEWFQEKFVPTVQKQLREMDVEPRAVLVLGNCLVHPNEDKSISKDSKVIAKFLPPNETPLFNLWVRVCWFLSSAVTEKRPCKIWFFTIVKASL